jgi:hypothetical protein
MTRRLTTGIAGAVLSALFSTACASDAPPERRVAPGAETPKAVEPLPPAPPARPIDTISTEWPGVEARLVTVTHSGQILFLEVQLANTGSTPVTIENFSAATATMTDDASKRIYEVFAAPGGGKPAATTDLTQTLAPGESTTFNAAFPVPTNARAVTVAIPRVGRFEDVRLDPADRERKAAEASNRATAK